MDYNFEIWLWLINGLLICICASLLVLVLAIIRADRRTRRLDDIRLRAGRHGDTVRPG